VSLWGSHRDQRRISSSTHFRNVFGPVKGFVYSVEYQKRGMPHIHMLITLDEEKLRLTPEFVNNIISAENVPEPDPNDHSEAAKQARDLRKLVGDFQHHDCSDRYCLRDDGKCEKRFPRDYSNETILSDNFTQYKRRATECGGVNFVTAPVKGVSKIITNQYVVPYNQFLLLKYGCHHDIEWVGSQQKALEYTLKYLLKGGPPGPRSESWDAECRTFQATTWPM
jgi:Helitron helicase-like domain at N-terminus